MSSEVANNPLKRASDALPVGGSPDSKKPKPGQADGNHQINDSAMEVEADEEEEDEMAGLDTNNIIVGSRTRGKQIDFTKAALEDGGDEDDEDDEDVVVGDDTMGLEDDEEESGEEEEEEEEEEAEADKEQ